MLSMIQFDILEKLHEYKKIDSLKLLTTSLKPRQQELDEQYNSSITLQP